MHLTNEVHDIQRLFRNGHTISITLWEQGKGGAFCLQTNLRLNFFGYRSDKTPE